MNKEVVIIAAGGTNFTSIISALQRLQFKSIVTNDPKIIKNAEKIILPGVGAAGHAMDLIHKQSLYEMIRSLQQPVLGICLGQQILCEFSEEDNVDCLGIFPIKVKKLQKPQIVPHMGWNNLIERKQGEPLLHDITTQDCFYFAHSFALEIVNDYCLGVCQYGTSEFAAIIKKNNFYGVQFHPEKSGRVGEKLLQNFLNIGFL